MEWIFLYMQKIKIMEYFVHASSNCRAPLTTRALYSPRLNPAAITGSRPFSLSTIKVAMLVVRTAAWVISVLLSSSLVPSKQILLKGNPKTWSAVL